MEEIKYKKNAEQVINLIKREFHNEITKRQEEVHFIQKRLLKAKKSLHLLKYVVIKSFYDSKDLNIINKDESSIKSNSNSGKHTAELQNRIHPAVKKLLGKKPLDFNLPLMRHREKPQTHQSHEIVEEQDVVTQQSNSNINLTLNTNQIVENKSLENEENIPRGNQKKTKHEIIVGNISKYSPSNNAQDVSSHKWMIYVRGPRNNPDISHIVKKVRFFLHPSYQPNDVIEIEESPFHLSRRGWGEFPVRVQIHFQYSSNKPIDIIHNLKLDQTRSGRQTLGNETLLNVWLYSITEIQEDDETSHPIKRIKQEVTDNCDTKVNKNSNVLDFYLQPSCSKTVFEPESNIIENAINIIHDDSGLRIIKEEPTNDIDYIPFEENSNSQFELKYENDSDDAESDYEISYNNPDVVYDEDRTFLFDHCYTDEIIHDNFLKATHKYAINIPVKRFKSTRYVVYFLFKSLPLITELAQDLRYMCCYPYVAESLEEFASWNIGKQRCNEWYRAKEIKDQLILHNIPDQKLWTIKFILMFGRAFAFTPFTDYKIFYTKKESAKTIPNQKSDLNKINTTLSEFMPISELMKNKKPQPNNNNDNYILDVENLCYDEDNKEQEKNTKHKSVSSETVTALNPMCTYIKQSAEDIGVILEDEEIIPNIMFNTTERILLKSVTCLAEELIRSAWANKVIANKGRNLDHTIDCNDIYRVLLEREEFDIFTNDGLGKNMNV